MYKAKLHDGEVEVMILAQEQKADLVILDDNAAKKTDSLQHTAAMSPDTCAQTLLAAMKA